MSITRDVLIGKLEALDVAVRTAHGPLATLDPTRAEATSFRVLGDRAVETNPEAAVLVTFGEGLIAVVEALCANFPENIFWDLDYLMANLLRSAQRSEMGPLPYLRQSFDVITGLQALFGRSSPIRFRYAHDFLYGFDWARWVRRSPETRAGIDPFDLGFLEYSRTRGHELLALIESNDAKYPRLEGPEARNPFEFSREPEDERVLHLDLSMRDSIPLRAWDPLAKPGWDRPYTDMRSARAEALKMDVRH